MMKKNKVLSWITGIAVIAVLGVFVIYSTAPQAPEPARHKLTLGAESSLLTAAVWIAVDQGFFKDEGVDVTIREFDSGRLSFQAMLNGEVDISTVAPTPIMFNSFNRSDFAIFSTIVSSTDDVKVIARGDKGIRTAKDLIGKRVGTPAGTTGQYFLAAFLLENHLPASAITEVNLPPSGLSTALEAGTVDAIVIWEPHALHAQQRLGFKAVQIPAPGVYLETFNLMTMRTIATTHPKALEGFLRAINSATLFIQSETSAAQNIVANRLRLNKADMIKIWDDFSFEVSLDQTLILILEHEARWAVKNQLTPHTTIPNYSDFIYPGAMKKALPNAITLID